MKVLVIMKEKNCVTVIGAGPVGLAAACLCKSLGLDVTILEEQIKSSQTRAGGIVLMPGSIPTLQSCGLSSRTINQKSLDLDNVQEYVDDELVFANKYSKMSGGIPAQVIRLKDIHRMLLSTCRSDILYGHKVEYLTQKNEYVKIKGVNDKGGFELTADSVILSDGKHSNLRKTSGFQFDSIDIDSVQVLAMSNTHESATPTLRIKRWKDAFITEVPSLRGDIHVCTTRKGIPHSMALEIANKYLSANLKLLDNVSFETHQIKHSMGVVKSYRNGRIFIAGDAAHNIHNLGAQGLNISLQELPDLVEAVKNTVAAEPSEWFDNTAKKFRYRIEDLLRHQNDLLSWPGSAESWFSPIFKRLALGIMNDNEYEAI